MSGKGEGRPYAFNSFSLFSLVTTYLRVTADVSLLDEVIDIPAQQQDAERGDGVGTNSSVLCSLYSLAADGQKRPQIGGLADYGGNMNLLECVPPYQHAVPALNAARIWMLLELANLDELLQGEGHTPRCNGRQEPAAMRRQASQVLLALRRCYDASGGGYWRSLQEDGSAVPVRTVIDFHTIGSLLGAPSASAMFAGGGSTTEQMRGEMASFVERELRTADWMRALSLSDDGANVSSFRPDHGTLGSYDAWPAQTMDALLTMAKPAAALSLLRAIANGQAVSEGPFGQAHTLFTKHLNGGQGQLCNTTAIPSSECFARKSGIWMMQSYNAASAAFANTVLRSLLGFQPPLPFGAEANSSSGAAVYPQMARGFTATLTELSYRGSSEWRMVSDAEGVRLEKLH